MVRVLITGGTGFIGRHLRDFLCAQNRFEIISLGCRSDTDSSLSVDLTQKYEVSRAADSGLFGERVDVVVHLASRLVNSENAQDTKVLYDNIAMSESVAYLATRLAARTVIHASTMAVYPDKTGTYNETALPFTSQNTEGLYGLSKLCSEQLLDFLTLHRSIRVIHLRLAQVYGDGMRSDRVLSQMRRELRETNGVSVYGNGERVSNFIKIEKVVEAICRFSESDASGLFNIGEEQLNYMQLAQRVIDCEGDSSSFIKIEADGSRAQVILDCSKYQDFMTHGERS